MPKKIVFTNGCFDIIHPGHIYLLNQAKSLGDVLYVGLNSDESISRIKPGRPINDYFFRKSVLEGLSSIDGIFKFEEDTPLSLIKKIKPDVLVKGGDWKIPDIVGSDFVLSLGGIVASIPFIYNYSSSLIIDKIRKMGNI